MRIISEVLRALFRCNIKSGNVKEKEKRKGKKTPAFLVIMKSCLTQLMQRKVRDSVCNSEIKE